MEHFCYECKFFSYNVMGEGVCGAANTRVGQYDKACSDNFELKEK